MSLTPRRDVLYTQPGHVTGSGSGTKSVGNVPFNILLRSKPTTAQHCLLRPNEALYLTFKKIVLGKQRTRGAAQRVVPRLRRLKSEAANPDQWRGPETGNPRKYGGLRVVSNFNSLCQTLLFCVNLYYSKPTATALWISHSTVTDFARLRGWSTSVPLSTAT